MRRILDLMQNPAFGLPAVIALVGFGPTSEFVIDRLNNGVVELLQKPRFKGDVRFVEPEFAAVPITMALQGKSGHVIAEDYRGRLVLAA